MYCTALNLIRFHLMGPAQLLFMIQLWKKLFSRLWLRIHTRDCLQKGYWCNIIIIGKVIGQYLKMGNVVAVTQQQLQRKCSLKVSTMTLSITVTYSASFLPQNVYPICCVQKCQFIPIWLQYFPMIDRAVNFYMYTLSSDEHRRTVTTM